ncbi:MAG: hypothetical protein HY331_03705 [Chloroflexi bacterium]|nr:hypothetical protein [Chloroflexota bacterium]
MPDALLAAVQHDGGRSSLITPEKRIPLAYQRTNEQFLAGLLDGLFGTDGNVDSSGTHPLLRLVTTSRELALDVRRVLLCFGIHARVYEKHTSSGVVDGRAIQSRHRRYELLISGEGLGVFRHRIGLSHAGKQAALDRAAQFPAEHGPWCAKIREIAFDGVERVYDLYEPTTDTWITEGAVSRGCGEQWLYGWDACNLGSINVARFATTRDGRPQVDWAALGETVRSSVRFLDDVIEINPFPVQAITNMVQSNRRIGLGIMGWADLLFLLGIPYDSEEALGLASALMEFITRTGREMSIELARERGPFPNFYRSIYKDGPPTRNSTVTTIAPTGTISIISNCSSGVEPMFALAYQHKSGERTLKFFNPIFEEVGRQRGFLTDAVRWEVLERGTVRGVAGVPDDVQRVFVTAHEVEPDWHVRMQAAFQRHTDNAVSKTVNLPNNATVDDIARAYRMAYDLGCLGMTVFRDGCKGEQVLNVGMKEGAVAAPPPAAAPAPAPMRAEIKPRPAVVHGYTRQIQAPEGKVNITVNSDPDGPLEVFVNVGRAGSDILALAEAVGRLISLILRLPSPLSQTERAREIANQLRGIAGSRSVGFGPKQVRSLPDAVAQALDQHLGEAAPAGANGHSHGEPAAQLALPLWTGNLCPNCGNNSLVYEEGCRKCHLCAYTEC